MRFSFLPIVVLSLLVLIVATLFAGDQEKPAARFEGKDTLLRLDGNREWVFAGSSLGVQYDEGKQQTQESSRAVPELLQGNIAPLSPKP